MKPRAARKPKNATSEQLAADVDAVGQQWATMSDSERAAHVARLNGSSPAKAGRRKSSAANKPPAKSLTQAISQIDALRGEQTMSARRAGQQANERKIIGVLQQRLAAAERKVAALDARYLPLEPAPLRPINGKPASPTPWEGSCRRKPWHYQITAVIPELDTPEELELGVELLRLQTERPFIIVVDTGSTNANLRRVEAMRAQDLEVHSLRLNGCLHPSEFVTAAMDLAFSICRTEFLYCTHSDCFPMRKNWLADLMQQCSADTPAVGYEITPRSCPGMVADWQGMLGHTATMLHMPTMDRIGGGWSMRRLAHRLGLSDARPFPGAVGWPDTEVLLGYLLRDYGYQAKVVGIECNGQRTLDRNIDHCRSLAGTRLYDAATYQRVKAWADDARAKAKERIAEWRSG